mmetsp:Transcript_4219/g.13381  ORF Transcript_4219/g.13381 Transcript_4219/m.13381 type:complete len:225 (+) Transcript_4219:502-1176(+)
MALIKALSAWPSRNFASNSLACSSSSLSDGPDLAAAACARLQACQRSSSRRDSARRAWTCAVRSWIRACRGCTTSVCTARASSSSCDSDSEELLAAAPTRCCDMMRSTCCSSSATTGASSRQRRCPACSCSAAMASRHLPMRSRKEAIISPTRFSISGASSCSKCRRNSALKTGAKDSCRASDRAVPTVSCNCFGKRRASSACLVATPPDFWTPRASASQNFFD